MDPAPIFDKPRRVAVIGAGFGGLAVAMRLQAAGMQTVLIEAREALGGRAVGETRDDFTFCAGPAALSDRAGLEELWALAGQALEHDVRLHQIAPLCRYSWPDGTVFNLPADPAELAREVVRFAPGDLAGFEAYAQLARTIHADFRTRPGPEPFVAPRDAAGMVRELARGHAWQSLATLVRAHVRDQRLREVLAVPALIDGCDPAKAPALLAADQARRYRGLWWPEGGFAALAQALGERLRGLGGEIVGGDPVCRIHLLGNRAHELELQSGRRERVDALVSTADRVHLWRDLLSGTPRGTEMARRTARLPHGPGLFSVHFALEGTWPGLPHCMVLFGPRFEALIEDILVHGVLPQDQIIFLSHPSLTDPTLAPAGKSVFQAQIPVANLGKLPIDWEMVGPLLEQRVLAEIGRRLVPDLSDRLTTGFHVTPRDLALEFNAFQGSGYGLAALPWWQFRRGHPLRDKTIHNLYFAGASAAPGGGLAAALAGSRACAAAVVENLS